MRFYANPYNICHSGFFFETVDEFNERVEAHPCEEFEVEFIDGDAIECAAAKAVGLNQVNVCEFIEWMEDNGHEPRTVAGLVYRCDILGEDFGDVKDDTDLDDYIVFETDDVHSEEKAAEEYAYQYVDDAGMLSEVPETVRTYFDYAAFARDMVLGGDITVFEIGRTYYIADAHR